MTLLGFVVIVCTAEVTNIVEICPDREHADVHHVYEVANNQDVEKDIVNHYVKLTNLKVNSCRY